jgi:hypothetical protein
MERRVTGNCQARCEAGEKGEIASNSYLPLYTAEFAVASLSTWWDTLGKQEYPEANELLLFCDSGSSNGSNNRLWKYGLQQFANRTGLTIYV